jgi:hypothetical protein
MSTEAIIILAVAAIVLIALFVAISRSSRIREQRRLKREREEAANRHREVAEVVHEEASQAEVEAQRAREEARRAEVQANEARERASMHEERAELHEKGLADHELATGRTDEAQADGYANEAAYADTARRADVRDERSTVIGDEEGTTPGAETTRSRFARDRDDEGVTRTDVEREQDRESTPRSTRW